MLAKTTTAKKTLDIFKAVSISAIVISSSISAFIPQWISDSFYINNLVMKVICIILGALIGYGLTTLIEQMLLNVYNEHLKHEAYALRQALIEEEEIDLDADEIKDVIKRLNLIEESNEK